MIVFCTGTMNEVILQPHDTVSACPGEQVTFVCRTNNTGVRWNVTIPNVRSVTRALSWQDTTQTMINITSDSSLIFSRTSMLRSLPFNSSLVFSNVTNQLNGTKVRCYRNIEFQHTTTLHVIRSGNEG